jgi:hypothetical protein
MTDKRFDPSDPDRRSPMLGEAIDSAVGKITTGIVIAGAIVGMAVYARPGPPRFDAFVVGEKIVRIDKVKGTIISCEGRQTCQLVLQKGQRLQRIPRTKIDYQEAAPAKALPAPPAAGK